MLLRSVEYDYFCCLTVTEILSGSSFVSGTVVTFRENFARCSLDELKKSLETLIAFRLDPCHMVASVAAISE